MPATSAVVERLSVPAALEKETLHHLPCSIGYNGPANVHSFFQPKSTGSTFDGVTIVEAAFRGRKLLGATVDIPAGYQGLVLAKRPLDASHEKEGEAIQEWTAEATFSALSYWKHDTTPSSADGVRRCFGWLQLADLIHSPVDGATHMQMLQKITASDSRPGSKRKLPAA
ncbi:ribonuclease H2 subunit C [Klebsormidium nitens]|uniref:Ribonuclease H2 subunit C n=1 Tax=Klebsormidium nitens TaxID=105231 RepID=A0A1Y1IF67_KLENI|nr:ribonuclease H2 subunit C [Klebsormidium nitens]|eukprot:GAQ87367.1 ribonuclease H2 subunit C [Klebsormidium nitens]